MKLNRFLHIALALFIVSPVANADQMSGEGESTSVDRIIKCEVSVAGGGQKTITIPLPMGALIVPIHAVNEGGQTRRLRLAASANEQKIVLSLSDLDQTIEAGGYRKAKVLDSASADSAKSVELEFPSPSIELYNLVAVGCKSNF